MVAGLAPFPAVPAPVMLLPLPTIDASSPAARQEMERVVREKFPDWSTWGEVCIDIIRYSTFEERARIIGDNGCIDLDMIFWAIEEAESPDPVQAKLWSHFRTRNPSGSTSRGPPWWPSPTLH